MHQKDSQFKQANDSGFTMFYLRGQTGLVGVLFLGVPQPEA